MKNEKDVKKITQKVFYDDNYDLIDLSLEAKGPEEDKLYLYD